MNKLTGNTRKLVMTAMLSAVATVLMFVDFSVPFMPNYIKMDISELPALIASFSMGPAAGVAVCLIKNLANLFRSQTGGIGELCNFFLGICFVLPAGLVYKMNKTKKGALTGCLVGAVSMAALSLPLNYFFIYPIYSKFMSMEAIIKSYQIIFPKVNSLFECLLIFNVPFTFIKGLLVAILTFALYKKIAPVIHGKG
ncbi:MAG: ECF transporter S component [Bacillota bacterium]|nr:ECF transporter S component [Bacillota bacterium]